MSEIVKAVIEGKSKTMPQTTGDEVYLRLGVPSGITMLTNGNEEETCSPIGFDGALMHNNKFGKVMNEFQHGTLHSGSKKGPRVRSRKQAKAIAVSEAKEAREY